MAPTHSSSYSPGKVTSAQVIIEAFFWKEKQEKLIMLCEVDTTEIRTGETIFLNNKGFEVAEIQIDKRKIETARQGAEVGIHLKGAKPADIKKLGGILLTGRRDH